MPGFVQVVSLLWFSLTLLLFSSNNEPATVSDARWPGYHEGLTLASESCCAAGSRSAVERTDSTEWVSRFVASLDPSSEPVRLVAALGSSATDAEIIAVAAGYFRNKKYEGKLWESPIPETRDPGYVDERADKAVEHFIITRAGGEQYPEELPWFDPNKKITTLSRFPHFDYLTPAYFHSGDERYASAMVRDMMDFVDHVPLSASKGFHVQMNLTTNPWNWVLLQWRVKRWIDALEYLRSSPSMTDAQFLRVMLHIWDEVDWLVPRKVLGLHNGTLGNLSAILYTSLHFPEAARAGAWQQDASSFFSAFLDTAFYPREFLVELTVGYSEGTLLMCLNMFSSMPESALRDEVRPKLEALVDAHVGVMKPDRSLPRYGDHGAYDIRDRLLRKSAELFGRSDLAELAANDDAVAPLSDRQSFPFESNPYYLSGYYAMRDGWDVNANYLSMDAGPFGTNHHHGDKLSITVSGDGAAFIVDPGTSLYTSIEPGPRIDLRPGFLHNVITVDGVDVNTGWDRHYAFDVLENRWVTNSTYDFLEGTYEFRNNLLDVIWRRSVFFRKGDYWIILDGLLGEGTHQVESNFQTMIGSDVEIVPRATTSTGQRTSDPASNRVLVKASNGAQLTIDTVLGDDLKPSVVIGDTIAQPTTFLVQYPSFVDWVPGGRGWVGTFGNESQFDATRTHPAPALLFEGSVSLPHFSIRVLSPSRKKVPVTRTLQWEMVNDESFQLKIIEDGTDIVDVLDWTIAERKSPTEKLADDALHWYRTQSDRVNEIIVSNKQKIVVRSGGETIGIEFNSPFEGIMKRTADGWSVFADAYLSDPVQLVTFTVSKGMLAVPRRFSMDGSGGSGIVEPGVTHELIENR